MYLYHVLFVAMNICGIDCQKKKNQDPEKLLVYPEKRGGLRKRGVQRVRKVL